MSVDVNPVFGVVLTLIGLSGGLIFKVKKAGQNAALAAVGVGFLIFVITLYNQFIPNYMVSVGLLFVVMACLIFYALYQFTRQRRNR